MAGVVPLVASTKETTNYSRLCRLLVDICSQALRDIFDGIHPPGNLHTVLASHPIHSTLQAHFKGKRKVLNPTQWCKLYPAIASSVSSATFDLTLLMVLLRNICGLRPPATGWGNLPSEADKSLEADIVRIKHFRNAVYAFAAQASVNDATFNTHWQNIREVMVRLGGPKYEDAIDKLKTECMDPDIEEHYKELLRQWKKDEYVIKEQLHEMGEDIKYMKEALRVALNNPGEEGKFPIQFMLMR